METPYFNSSKYPSVYEPSEDTFLLMDALEAELHFIKKLKPSVIAEIGSGSGLNITSLSKALNSGVFCLSTDINKDACAATKNTALFNNGAVNIFNMSFLDFFRKNMFDVILFNPPYVVTESEEIHGFGIERSWAGGIHGREVIDQLLPKIYDLLSDNGVFYMVVIDENKPEEIMYFMSMLKFKVSIIMKRQVRGEKLSILKFQKMM